MAVCRPGPRDGPGVVYPLPGRPAVGHAPVQCSHAPYPECRPVRANSGRRFSRGTGEQAIAEIKQLRPLFLGDFYPLLPIGTSQGDWHAYQADRPDLRQGCVLMFRRPESRDSMREIRLENIDPDAEYSVAITGETYEQAPVRTMWPATPSPEGADRQPAGIGTRTIFTGPSIEHKLSSPAESSKLEVLGLAPAPLSPTRLRAGMFGAMFEHHRSIACRAAKRH